jgi:hypothetical protein
MHQSIVGPAWEGAEAVSLHVCQGDAGMVAVHSTGGVETALELCITDSVTGYAVSTDVYT